MLTIKNLSIYIDRDLRLLLEGFSFSLNPGDKAVLIGEEGNGKSTIIKAIFNQETIQSYASIRGTIDKSKEIIGYLPQQLDTCFKDISTDDYLEKMVGFENLDYALAYQLLEEFKLEDYFFGTPVMMGQLSGGELVKFLLLVELLKKPTLLLLDEPSNDLDYGAVLWLEKFISTTPLPVLFISHDLSLISNCANVIIHLEQLKNKSTPKHTISRMAYDSYVEQYHHNLERQDQQAKKQKEEYQRRFDRYNQVYQRVNHELNSVSRQLPGVAKNLKDKMHSVKAQGKRLEKQKAGLIKKPDYEQAIEISFPPVAIPQTKVVLDFATASLNAGERVLATDLKLVVTGPRKIAIVGKNGSGKTTLLREIRHDLEQGMLEVGYMPQNYLETMDHRLTPVEFVASTKTKDLQTQVRTFLGSSNFTREEMLRPIGELSGGQKAKLFFLKMIFSKAQVLLLDEPTRNLSPLSSRALIEALKQYQGAVIAISHDRTFLREVFDEGYLLEGSLKQIDLVDYLK
ncbi:MAG: ATP-binding cassette domain-containing protein [Erysipelotrichaceae bacterium]|nr:ATP-binding cassette domain-containing protein [Erysipelotrichaceae bacterium]MDD3809202.1 ATP-binding cassette domain-containing protein [Erysipelotrichaceae bacterium]